MSKQTDKRFEELRSNFKEQHEERLQDQMDKFAIAALQGLLASGCYTDNTNAYLARVVYEYAQSMLEERADRITMRRDRREAIKAAIDSMSRAI